MQPGAPSIGEQLSKVLVVAGIMFTCFNIVNLAPMTHSLLLNPQDFI